MWRTLQWYITAVPNNTRPQKVFSVGWNLSFVYVNQLFPLFLPCSAREIIFFIVLLDEQKIARTFSNEKRVSNFNFAGMENYIMVKQSGRWLNELNSWNTFYYAKFFRLLRSFDCMKTRAMRKFCKGI